MGDLRFSKSFSLVLIIAFVISAGLWLLSCTGAPQPYAPGVNPLPGIDLSSGDDSNTPTRRSSRRERTNCREIGSSPCEGNADCEDICDDIFSSSKARKCKALNVSLVEDFENIFYILDEGEEFDSINDETLDCLLDISETEFAKEVGKLNSGDIKDFLEVVAEEEDLAHVLASEDDDHKILEKLLDKLSSSAERLEAFKTDVESRDTFIDLIVDNENEEAWDWVTEYISEQCSSSSYCAPGKTEYESKSEVRELVFFCKIYDGSTRTSNLSDLLEADFFNDRYGSFIENLAICGEGSDPCQPNNVAHFGDSDEEKTVCNEVTSS